MLNGLNLKEIRMILFTILCLAIGFGLHKANDIPTKYKKPGIIGVAGLWFLVTCYSLITIIKPGTVGVLVNLFGNERGVEEKELTIGAHFIAPWKELYVFPIYEQNHSWVEQEGFNFQTAEGLSVHADIGITFNLEPSRIHELFCKYRRGMDEITHIFIRNYIRDAINKVASRMKIEDLIGPMKEEFFDLVEKDVQKYLEPLGFHISKIFIIGRFNVPENVMGALNKKIEATQLAQQRENELREAEAQAKKEIAISEGKAQSMIIESEAKAKANRLLAQQLSKEVLYYHAIQKWDGVLPAAMGTNNLLTQLKP
jgi:regulator of protease activity HflC (stomatin/prohibitin superfamily)